MRWGGQQRERERDCRRTENQDKGECRGRREGEGGKKRQKAAERLKRRQQQEESPLKKVP